MTLFITSSPFLFHHSPATLDPANQFLERLGAVLPEHPKTLFVCSDPKDRGLTYGFAEDAQGAFERAGLPLGEVAVLDGKTAWMAYRLVRWADFIILMGGHLPTQNAFFKKIRLRRLIQKFEGVVMGISAGSMNCAEWVYAQPEEPGESSPEFPRFLRGLGLTQYNILPHYQQVKDYELDGRRLYEDITYADSMGHTFYVFPDGTYLYQDFEETTILGEAYRLSDGILEKLTEKEECYRL